MADRIPLWLDCDTGHDDAFALLLATQDPRLRLLGVSTTHGNASLDDTTRNTCAVLTALGVKGDAEIPVVRGNARPLRGEPHYAPSVHGITGLDGVPSLPFGSGVYDLNNLSNGVEPIYNAIAAEPPGTVWLVAVGPLTNVAQLIAEHPDVVSRLRGLSIMGGAVGNGFTAAPPHRADGFGNWSPWAEFNIKCDPLAAKQIFGNVDLAKKTILTTLDLTHQCRGVPAVQELLFGGGEVKEKSPIRVMMRQVLNFFAAAYRRRSGMEDGPPLHDPIAIFAITDRDRVGDAGGERFSIDVVCEGKKTGHTVLQPVLDGAGGVTVPRSVDLDVFWRTIDDALTSAEKRTPLR